jgi:hypothetical protein
MEQREQSDACISFVESRQRKAKSERFGEEVEAPHYWTRACSLATEGTQEGGVGVVEKLALKRNISA